MAEYFNNYLTSRAYSPNQQQDIVPKAGESISSNGVGSRTSESVVQLHSIYVSLKVDTNQTSNPTNNAAFITLSVYDTSKNAEYPIAYNVMVLPHSSFYIEKTITLKKQDKLIMRYSNTPVNTGNKTLSTVCSGVELY